jgi:pimeloyl-ACP methyl ester carboxylesterase
MKNFRTYGNKPYRIALLHGGPGAAGSLGKFARELSMELNDSGILEPLQTADSMEGQIEELREIVEQHAELPVVLIGHSWGAMLGYLFAAKHPSYVKQLIMVGSGLFEASYAKNIMQTRLNRLSPEKQAELNGLMDALENNNSVQDPDLLFHQRLSP